jgi:hypothetical protein
MLRATAGIAAATFTIEAAEAEWRSLTPAATSNETTLSQKKTYQSYYR